MKKSQQRIDWERARLDFAIWQEEYKVAQLSQMIKDIDKLLA